MCVVYVFNPHTCQGLFPVFYAKCALTNDSTRNPADVALLMMEGTAVEFPAGATPKDVLASKANGMETRAAELEAGLVIL